MEKKRVLNVGGGSKTIGIPKMYREWDHLLLDIDPLCEPDVVCDARELHLRPPAEFDAVYCSHNLEHYFHHDAVKVAKGFRHVLKPDGFAHIAVPDIGRLMRLVAEHDLDIEDVVLKAGDSPLRVRDVVYGWASKIEESGKDYYAHKTGFTTKSLADFLINCGFPYVYVGSFDFEAVAFAFLTYPDAEYRRMLDLPDQS